MIDNHANSNGKSWLDRRWHVWAIAGTVAILFFLTARLGLGLPASSTFVAVFWPAMGLGVGVLIALDAAARWPVLAAITVANFLANWSNGAPPQIALATCLSEATECLVPTLLVQRWFGAGFSLSRLRGVLGLLAAGAFGSAAGAVCWIALSRLFYGSVGPIPTIFLHWFMSDLVGFVAVAPFVIGLFEAVRNPPPRREIVEGIAALAVLAATVAVIIPLPPLLWATALPIAWLFPMLLWLTARCRPVFAASAAVLVSTTIVATAVFGIGHFGDPRLPADDRILLAQATILFVAISASVLAALFAERKESEAQLALSKIALERERDNRLTNAQAAMASVAHEIKQPLTGIAAYASAALRYLDRTPPHYGEAKSALTKVAGAVEHTRETLDGLRTLFGGLDRERHPVDVNQIVRDVLEALQAEFRVHGIGAREELTVGLPQVSGHRGQLREVVFNLIGNAIEAMIADPYRRRRLRVTTALLDDRAIAVSIEDTGPGIDPERIEGIFAVGLTTKASGTGLGLPICRRIVEHHGGKLTVKSDGRTGALFQFTLPIEPGE
jgi:signal transduction histidine kinase